MGQTPSSRHDALGGIGDLFSSTMGRFANASNLKGVEKAIDRAFEDYHPPSEGHGAVFLVTLILSQPDMTGVRIARDQRCTIVSYHKTKEEGEAWIKEQKSMPSMNADPGPRNSFVAEYFYLSAIQTRNRVNPFRYEASLRFFLPS